MNSPRLRILVVEDNDLSRQVAEVLLRHLGHECLLAGDGQQALQILSQQTVDLVLLDVAMPVMDGLTALQQLRSRADLPRQVPVLMLTAHVRPQELSRYSELGANGCIAKPISTQRLREELAQLFPGRFDPA